MSLSPRTTHCSGTAAGAASRRVDSIRRHSGTLAHASARAIIGRPRYLSSDGFALLSGELFEKPGVNDVAEHAFRRHYGQVYRYVRRRTRDHHRAEDLTQQVFADAVAGLGESSSPSLAWLYTVARRRFADESRRDTLARRMSELRLVAGESSESRDYGPDVAGSLREAIERLAPGQREVVALKLLRGARFAEIGERLGISTEAAKMRFVRALEALRSELEEEGLRP
jgi:RNA polymerase sigma-70 factor, ECF subfamily